jgi:hypothetical protein
MESLQSIDRFLDFGNGVTVQAYADLIDQMRQKLATYNILLSQVDDAQREVELMEQSLQDLSKRLMTNVVARYGEDSREYRMAGGKQRAKGQRTSSRNVPTVPTSVSEMKTKLPAAKNGASAKAAVE